MHIAICDDNVADRKHLERLLKRESDNRKSHTGVFYVDSFGQFNALANAPMQYNLFFMDLTASDINGYQAARQLKSAGVTAPIVLCSSKIDYEAQAAEFSQQPELLLFLKKPFVSTILTGILDQAIRLSAQVTPAIELRCDQETFYVSEADILYGTSAGLRGTLITLTNNRTILVAANIQNIYPEVSVYGNIAFISKSCFVNYTHVERITMTKCYLQDGTVLKASPLYSRS